MKFIEPYDPNWKIAFENIKQAIEAGLSELAQQADIQHIGSTAIPGLVAKPVLDIDIILADKNLLQGISAKLEHLGYINRGEQGIAGRFAFRQSSAVVPFTTKGSKWQSHHLYVCYADSLALKNHLLFRDMLINNVELVRQYADLKLSLMDNWSIMREEYTSKKTDFILSVLAAGGLSAIELEAIGSANS